MDTKERTRQPQRRRPPSAPAGRKPQRRTTQPTRQPAKPVAKEQPEVVYLPAQRFSRNRLILQLVSVAAVVVALILGISVFFKVETIQVSGNVKYSAWDISQASGIQTGENLLTLGIPQAVAKIQAALPYVESVRIGIKLPNTVNIEIVESEVAYALEASDGTWWLVNSSGKVLEQIVDGGQKGYTNLQGMVLEDPIAGEQAVAMEKDGQTDADGNPIPVTVTQAQRLTTAQDIADFLERNGIIGKVTSINVSDMGNIELWYGQQFQVLLGDDTQLLYKISCLKAAVDEMAPYQAGVLDISFTTWPDGVGFTPFPSGQ
jgi:cell division protein FtsQ